MSKPIAIVAGQPEVWAQLCPFGEFLGRTGKVEVLQICDQAAFDSVVANFSGEILVDAEHNSLHETGDTVAYGWITGLRTDPTDGLMACLRLTDLGEADVVNRRRRYLSPVWPLDRDGRPESLASVALTNRPNIRMRPVLNKASLESIPAPTAGSTTTQTQRTINMDLKKIAVALGLTEEATVEEVLAAVEAAKVLTDAQAKRIAELEQGALEVEADEVMEANKGKIANMAEFKSLYCANKDIALAILATVAAPAPARTVANKTEAKLPAGVTRTGATKLEAYRAMPTGKDKDDYLAANKAELLRLDAQARAQG